MVKSFKSLSLFARIMIGFGLGIVVGLIMGPEATMFKFLGDILIRLLKMVVAPLIFCLMISAIGDVADMKTFGSIGIKTIITYVILTFIAIGLGLGVALLFNVGEGVSINTSEIQVAATNTELSFIDTIVNMVPENIFKSLTEGDLIQIIIFAMIFGFALTKTGEVGKQVLSFVQSIADIMKKVVNIVLGFTPLGVFGLIANVIGRQGLEILIPYAKVIAAVYVASAIQTVVVHGGIISKLICKVDTKRYLQASKESMGFAFATCSSVATIPLALKATRRLGVPENIGNFIVTIGSNMSMDGIAIYQGVAVVFATQIFGIELTVSQYLMAMFAATLASLGSAGVPGSGLIVLSIVVETVGLPMETVGILAGVDRILNMGRIIPNVTADIATSLLVSKLEGTLDLNPQLVED